MPITVSNSTPLIHLAKIRQLHLLPEFFGTLLIPQAVYTEVGFADNTLALLPQFLIDATHINTVIEEQP